MPTYHEYETQQQKLLDNLFNKWRNEGANENTIGELDRYDVSVDTKEGESGTAVIVFTLPLSATKEEAVAFARDRYNSHCQHEHDCCGHVYGNVLSNTINKPPRMQQRPEWVGTWTIVYSWHRNI